MPTKRTRITRARSGALHRAVYELCMTGSLANERDRLRAEFAPERVGLVRDATMAETWRANVDAVREQWLAENGNTARTRRAFRERERAVLADEASLAPVLAARAAAQRVAAEAVTPTASRAGPFDAQEASHG